MDEVLKDPSLLERRWASHKQLVLIAIFQKINLSELQEPSKYLSPQIAYVEFMKYLRSTGSANPKMGSLLEVAEQTIERVQHILLNARELWTEMPEELINISLDAELLKQFETQLDDLIAISSEFASKLQAFIDGHYLEASILFPMFQELSKLCDSYLTKVNRFFNTVRLNIRSINPKIENEEVYRNLESCFNKASEKDEKIAAPARVVETSDSSIPNRVSNAVTVKSKGKPLSFKWANLPMTSKGQYIGSKDVTGYIFCFLSPTDKKVAALVCSD